jgi:parallel beta-helix repeat protein
VSIIRRLIVACGAAVVAGGSAWVPAAHAASTVVTCGQTVTTSITLANDVGPCLGDGLVVSANNVTVDLGGHTVRGAGTDPAGAVDQAGVRLDNVSGVTVRRGTVRDFFVGVLVKGGSKNTITGVTATNNVGSGTTTYGEGIAIDGSNNNTIANNTVTFDGPYAGIDMINGSSHNLVSHNNASDNHVPAPGAGPNGEPGQEDIGISVDSGASFNTIDGNQANRNGFFGISLAGPPGTEGETASHNVANDNGNIGINAGTGGMGHLVFGNSLDHNGYEQFGPSNFPGFDFGVVTCGACFGPGTPTTIKGNTVTRTNGPGIALLFNGSQFLGGTGRFGTFPPRPYQAPRSNVVQGNRVQNNIGDGIYVECDKLYDANFQSTCHPNPPPHVGMRILTNTSTGNGGAGAGTTAWDLHDGNGNCNFDVWKGNKANTGNPPCTLQP